MTHPDDDALAAIALGDPAPSGAAEHARSCASCSDDAGRAARHDDDAARPGAGLVAPPASVWDAVEAELDREPDTTAADRLATRRTRRAPASAVDAGDDLADRRAARSERRRFPLAWVAGAAAAGLVIGVVGARRSSRRPAAPARSPSRAPSLDTLDTQQAKGTADVVRHDGRLDLAVSTQPIDPGDGYLEVWLINKDLKRMVSVGVLEPGEDGQSFAIPQDAARPGLRHRRHLPRGLRRRARSTPATASCAAPWPT